jgi:hypothetical protein
MPVRVSHNQAMTCCQAYCHCYFTSLLNKVWCEARRTAMKCTQLLPITSHHARNNRRGTLAACLCSCVRAAARKQCIIAAATPFATARIKAFSSTCDNTVHTAAPALHAYALNAIFSNVTPANQTERSLASQRSTKLIHNIQCVQKAADNRTWKTTQCVKPQTRCKEATPTPFGALPLTTHPCIPAVTQTLSQRAMQNRPGQTASNRLLPCHAAMRRSNPPLTIVALQ